MNHRQTVPIGVPGLDELLSGGLTGGQLYLIEGTPGTGKTTFALQFLLEGLARGEKVLYITLSETKEELAAVARSHNWSLEGFAIYDLKDVRIDLQAEEPYTVLHPSEVELDLITARLIGQVEKEVPQRAVIDSLSELRILAEDPFRYRRQVLAIKEYFADRKCTALLLDDHIPNDSRLQVESIVHGVFLLRRTSSPVGVSRRQIQLLKMRGLPFRDAVHDFSVQTGGLEVFPSLGSSAATSGKRFVPLMSGIPELDHLTGGGLDHGTSTLLMGAAGTGKSSLSTQYVRSAAAAGEPVSCFFFDEDREMYVRRSKALGVDLHPYVESGLVRIEQVDSTNVSPGEFSHRVLRNVQERGARVVVIDSLNGYMNAMPSEQFLLVHMHELLSFLNRSGVLSILIVAQHGLFGTGMSTPIDISYLADTVILLRYFEAMGQVKQALSVIKKRNGSHERSIRELSIGVGGIRVGPPLSQFRGVLAGIPEYRGDDTDLLRR